MIYTAYELLAKLRLLVLWGQEDGELVWVGTDKQWKALRFEEESILRDNELKKTWTEQKQ